MEVTEEEKWSENCEGINWLQKDSFQLEFRRLQCRGEDLATWGQIASKTPANIVNGTPGSPPVASAFPLFLGVDSLCSSSKESGYLTQQLTISSVTVSVSRNLSNCVPSPELPINSPAPASAVAFPDRQPQQPHRYCVSFLLDIAPVSPKTLVSHESREYNTWRQTLRDCDCRSPPRRLQSLSSAEANP